MHGSVASSYGSSSEQLELLQLAARHPQQPQRAALPSLASLRMQTPQPYVELAQSPSAAAAQHAPFGAASGRNSSLSTSNSTLNSSRSSGVSSSSSSNGSNSFWKNPILYKTTICDNWAAKKVCKYAARCWYAHGFGELRYVPRLDQLPENVREALFVEPALARAFFQEMTSTLDNGYASSRGSECESRASMASSSSSADSCRLSTSPSSTMSDAISPMSETLMYSPVAAPATSYLADRRAQRWAPGATWSEGAETPRASRVPGASVLMATVPKQTASRAAASSDYQLFDAAHPLAIDLSFLKE